MGSYVPLIGRIALSIIFILNGIRKVMDFEQTWKALDIKGIPMSPFVLILAVLIELGGGLAILFGFNTKLMATLLIVYLIPTTFLFHPIWNDMALFDHFIKNVAIIGGLMFIAHFGAGPRSLDAKGLW